MASDHPGIRNTPLTKCAASVSAAQRSLVGEMNSLLGPQALSVVVLGASGDLAIKKTFPSLFKLFERDLLPKHTNIVGYARSNLSPEAFEAKIRTKLPLEHPCLEAFLARCTYFQGQYDSTEAFTRLNSRLIELEIASGHGDNPDANRLFYMALPPTVFASVSGAVSPAAMSQSGWNRVVIEKPFGRDSESSAALSAIFSARFAEEQLYRIDHYLGKEIVQNLMTLRFANMVFEPLWNANSIKSVVISFKEPFGTKGRGGYFDEFGIIRDVMQNHLLQILTLVAMEAPATLDAKDIRDEKVKVLRSVAPITREDIRIGQYKGYLDDEQVPNDSVTPTFAQAVVWINNNRWKGVPFILRCGKALNERKSEIRIQFRRLASAAAFSSPGQDESSVPPNELVMRVQPDEAIYLKLNTKTPGISQIHDLQQTELDLSYAQRFTEDDHRIPDAYERLLLDVLRGDQSLFVRNDELHEAWRVFTPILHQLEQERIEPIIYEEGVRGLPEAYAQAESVGVVRPNTKYKWQRSASVADKPSS